MTKLFSNQKFLTNPMRQVSSWFIRREKSKYFRETNALNQTKQKMNKVSYNYTLYMYTTFQSEVF
ncbi:hypothetical protein A8F95_11485 [Bacillus wudalianchiensis]|uniref:Uncharacterized protein n=1 Tax=Pseudobacillus wudalianchiensis TaxID=1743143 RepID=A0A1B9ANA0_9BACI|nr:hypothetical protein A8F95_11485 [Bacillus wudalianchiensis]